MNTRCAYALLGAALLSYAGAAREASAQSPPPFSIDWHVISAGGTTLRTSCFRLTGSAGQAVPGYSSGGIYAVLSGYFALPSTTQADSIFLDGFEECSP